MPAISVSPGRERGIGDGSRRFTPVQFSFDSRASLLTTTIESDWEPQIKDQWLRNQSALRQEILFEYGIQNYEQKIQNFIDVGAAPISLVALHNLHLSQVRAAFISTHYYPALLGAGGLGERILNQLILSLRNDHLDHELTRLVAGKHSFDNWKDSVQVLQSWGVFDEQVASDFLKLSRRRHGAVHYRPSLDTTDARKAALDAVLLLGQLIQAIFPPIGDRPFYFQGPIGRSYVRREFEQVPFVREFVLPACVCPGKSRFSLLSGL